MKGQIKIIAEESGTKNEKNIFFFINSEMQKACFGENDLGWFPSTQISFLNKLF